MTTIKVVRKGTYQERMTTIKVVRKGTYQGVPQWGISTSTEITLEDKLWTS